MQSPLRPGVVRLVCFSRVQAAIHDLTITIRLEPARFTPPSRPFLAPTAHGR